MYALAVYGTESFAKVSTWTPNENLQLVWRGLHASLPVEKKSLVNFVLKADFLKSNSKFLNALELFLRSEEAPFTFGQAPQFYSPDSHPLKSGYPEPHGLAHPANLPLFPFTQNKFQLILILP